jgi:hypothetical protein
MMFVVVLLVGVPLAVADAPQTGVVSGTVLDPDGQPLPGATVKLEGDQGTMSKISGDDGGFLFVFLVPGTYTVRADMSGFQSAAGEIDVSAGGRAMVELRLSEAMGEEIVITGESPLVNRFDMTGGGSVEKKEFEAIAGQSREYKSRLVFLPEVHNEPGSDRDLGRAPVIAGHWSNRNVYFIDGLDVSFARSGGGSTLELPPAAVSQMKMESAGADAEFSRTTGAFTQTTIRSGTNAFHGSVQAKAENLAWNADNKNFPTERPDDIKAGVDATLGGPMVRDKLWFFLTYRYDETPRWDVMADGVSVVDVPTESQTALVKIDWRPSAKHTIFGLYSDTPYDLPWWARNTYGDLETVQWFNWGGDLASLGWNYAINDNLLLTTRLGTTQSNEDREPMIPSNIEPGCGPEDPCGNNWVYRPLDGNRLYVNGNPLPLGTGYTAFPRDQVNAALEWFTGNHDIKLGADYQRTAWDTGGVNVPLCRGRLYDENAPGGFGSNVSPRPTLRGYCLFYPTKADWEEGWGPSEQKSENLGIFVRDRFTLKKWTFNLGLRADTQKQENDVGQTTLDSTDVMPRLAASYDVFGDSKLILNAAAGRYYMNMSLNWTNKYNALPKGNDQYEAYRWSLTTQGYDDLVLVRTGEAIPVELVDPWYKDEATLGAEWQFHRDWALQLRASWWEYFDLVDRNRQMDPETGVYWVTGAVPGAKADRTAATVIIRRRFRQRWMLSGSYTWSETMDNCGFLGGSGCTTNFGELQVWTNEDGVPISEQNKWGKATPDRTHNFKLRGIYNLPLGGRHTLNFAGLVLFHSGKPWMQTESMEIPDELNPLDQTVNHNVYLNPRGTFRLDERFQLDLNVEWRFPLGGAFDGWLRAEIINVTDEQILIATAGLPTTGVPTASSENYLYPRTIRAYAGFSF